MNYAHSEGKLESRSKSGRTLRRPRDMRGTPASVRDVWVGIDFGTSSIRAAFTEDDQPPVQIPMGETHDVSGGRVTSYKFPTAVWFKGPAAFELLGHRKTADFGNIASGVKQSLDTNMCREKGQGERFMALCKKHGVDKTAIILALFKNTLDHITTCLDAQSSDRRNMARVNISVPVLWSVDKRGQDIQNEIERIAVEAGFPQSKICFDTETGSALAYLARKYGSPKRRRRIFLIDVGAGTVDVAGAEVDDARVLLVSDPRGCSGGMADGWLALQEVCIEATGGADRAAVLFQAARDHVHEMNEVCEPFALGQHNIPAETFERIVHSCYEGAVRMARREFHSMEDVDVVTICGSATASNAHIKSIWLRQVEQWRREQQTTTGGVKFDIDVLQSEDAVKAVCTGASITYAEEPTEEFRKRCFGILCGDADGVPEGPMIIEMKSPCSDEVESGWEKVRVHTQPDDFTIEPHMITSGRPLTAPSFHSEDTGRRIWPGAHATPMNPIVFDLSGLAKRGDEVMVRFTRPGQRELALEVSHAALGGGWLGRVDLRLCRDRDRLFLAEIGRQSANP